MLSKTSRDGVDQIAFIRAALTSRRSAVKPSECENVAKMSKKKRQDPQPGTLSKRQNLCITSRSKKDQFRDLTVALTKTVGLGFEHININAPRKPTRCNNNGLLIIPNITTCFG